MGRAFARLNVEHNSPWLSLNLELCGPGNIERDCQYQSVVSFLFIMVSWLVFPNRGKGDYFRLGHGTDVHVRKPQMVEGLRGKKIVHVAVGALHCLAVTETGQVCTDLHHHIK